MQGKYKKMFWEEFDDNFELYHSLVLLGMTDSLLKNEINTSSFKANYFYSPNQNIGRFYIKIGSLLLKKEGLENDILLSIEESKNHINSINLNRHLTNDTFYFAKYNAFDGLYSSKYGGDKKEIFRHFSYLLGNFVRYYENNRFIINDTKRLYILTCIMENFCCNQDRVKLIISNTIDGSFIELYNDELLSRLRQKRDVFLKL